jgi:RES domain-containing protein
VTRTGWRIVPEDQAATAFDGEGARLYGGRWNSVGCRWCMPASTSRWPRWNLRVHIDRTRMRKSYQSFAFRFDERLMEVFRAGALPKWMQEPPAPRLQQIGDDWVSGGVWVILAVPSAIVRRNSTT